MWGYVLGALRIGSAAAAVELLREKATSYAVEKIEALVVDVIQGKVPPKLAQITGDYMSVMSDPFSLEALEGYVQGALQNGADASMPPPTQSEIEEQAELDEIAKDGELDTDDPDEMAEYLAWKRLRDSKLATTVADGAFGAGKTAGVLDSAVPMALIAAQATVRKYRSGELGQDTAAVVAYAKALATLEGAEEEDITTADGLIRAAFAAYGYSSPI